ncbi:MAG: hypothetical protein JW940_09320 [Polyangiaceae bacterium]|nr:hypothetical protein [Polyangiaceae bacterium]
MGAIGVVAGAVSAGASAAAGAALQAAMQAAQAVADAAALAMGALAGKDPGIPPTIGAIMMGSPTVLIGGFPMPDVLSLLGGIAKALKKIGKAIGKSKGFGKALKKIGLCNNPGEPINPFTGEVYNDFEDYVASDTGVRWERHYRSGWNEQDGPLGYGHRHGFERSLTLLRKRALYATHDNEQVALERNDDGTFTPVDGFSLRSQDGHRFELTTDRDETLVYTLRPGSPPTGRLDHYTAPGVDVYLYYDQQDRLSALTEPSARGTVDTHFFYDAAGHITEVHRGLRGQAPVVISRYVYQDGCLVEWHDALGGVKRFRYDGQHRMVQGTDRRGYSFHWEYDPQNGRCIRSYGDDGLWGVQAKYEGAQSVFTEPDGSTWTYKFFPDGTISHLLGPDGGVVQYIRDEGTGRIVRQMEPGGKEYTWLYDASGKHFGRLDPYGNLVPPEDDDPNPNSLAHDGPETAKGYLCGRPLAELAPALAAPPGAVAAQLAAMQAPSQAAGVRSPPARDALDRVVEQYEPDGSVRQFHYDPEGNVVGERLHVPGNGSNGAAPQQGPRGGWLTREYTSWNLLAAETSPLGSTTRYEYTHREDWRVVVDPNGNRTEYVRDQRHRLAEIHRFGGVHRRYVHDLHDAVIEEQDGDGNSLVKYETDPNGLHTTCTLSSGECYSYEYDSRGQFTLASSSRHEVVQRHAGNRIAVDRRDGKGIEHRYDSTRQVSGTQYFDHFGVRYEYSPTRQIRITTPEGSTHTLWHTASQTIRENGNGTCEALTFDSEERLTARACWHRDYGHEGPFWATSYRYSAAGELLTRIDTQTGADQYEYDADHRLVAHHNSHGPGQYEYDPAGNLTRTPRHGLIKCGAGNLVEQADFTHFSHDRRYRRARRDDPGGRVVEYHYDSLDQLVEARFSDTGKVWRAAYDGLGRRVWREVDGERTDFYWDDDRLAAERFPDGRLRLYVYPNEDALVPFMWLDYESEDADPKSGKAYYLFTEPSGMPVRVEDADGIEIWRAAATDPYGRLEGKNGAPCPTRLRFVGHFDDEQLGLFYNRFRDYDPDLGRYLQPDPLGHAGGINLFAYSTNPLVEVDLRGLVHKASGKKKAGDTDSKKKPAKEKTKGQELAEKQGLPDAPDGYHWVDVGGTPRLRSNPGSENPPLIYNKKTGKFEEKPPESAYPRVSHSEADRQKVYDSGKNDQGVVPCAVCGEPVKSPKAEDMDMGHKSGKEYATARDEAVANETPRSEFRQEQKDLDNYRPEHPSCNRSHKGEAGKTGSS